MIPKDFLKSKNIPEPTYNGVRLVDDEMEAYKITDLLYEYAIITLNEASGDRQRQYEALILPDVSVAYELLKETLEYAQGKQISLPIERIEEFISEYER